MYNSRLVVSKMLSPIWMRIGSVFLRVLKPPTSEARTSVTSSSSTSLLKAMNWDR